MGAPSPPPQPAPQPAPAPVASSNENQKVADDRQRKAQNKRGGRSSLIVNRGGAAGLGDSNNSSIQKKTLG